MSQRIRLTSIIPELSCMDAFFACTAACRFPLRAIGCLASAYEHFSLALLAQTLLSGSEKLVTSRIAAAPRFLIAFGIADGTQEVVVWF